MLIEMPTTPADISDHTCPANNPMTKVISPFPHFSPMPQPQSYPDFHLLNIIEALVPKNSTQTSKPSIQQTKMHPYVKLATQKTAKPGYTVAQIIAHSQRPSSSFIFDSIPKKRYYRQDKKRANRELIREVLKKSKESNFITEAKEKLGRCPQEEAKKKREHEQKRCRPPYRPTVLRSEDLFEPEQVLRKKEKHRSSHALHALKVMEQIRKERLEKVVAQEEKARSDCDLAETPETTHMSPRNQGCLESAKNSQELFSSKHDSSTQVTSHTNSNLAQLKEFAEMFKKSKQNVKREVICLDEEEETEPTVKEEAEYTFFKRRLLEIMNKERLLLEREQKIELKELYSQFKQQDTCRNETKNGQVANSSISRKRKIRKVRIDRPADPKDEIARIISIPTPEAEEFKRNSCRKEALRRRASQLEEYQPRMKKYCH